MPRNIFFSKIQILNTSGFCIPYQYLVREMYIHEFMQIGICMHIKKHTYYKP